MPKKTENSLRSLTPSKHDLTINWIKIRATLSIMIPEIFIFLGNLGPYIDSFGFSAE